MHLRRKPFRLLRKFVQSGIDLCRRFRQALTEHVQFDGQQRQILTEAIVEFLGNSGPFGLLRVEKSPAEVQRGLLRPLVIGDVAQHPVRADRVSGTASSANTGEVV